jgi:uncharacterized caspase-like protein
MSVRRLLPLLSLAVCLLACSQALAGEKRVALIIGNSAYKNVAKLTNPANDAAMVADMFKTAGFTSVVKKADLGVVEMRKVLRDFGNMARDADVAVVYYAGHGIELDGNNYLIPTDATLETDSDILDETLALDRVLFAIDPAKQLRLVILDACRDNPFAKTMKRSMASRAVGRGLAKVEPSSPNTLIAFSAKAGFTSSDGDGSNSPFAAALVQHLTQPGLDLRKAFGFVRDDVLKVTNNAQEPFIYGSLGGNDVALVPAAPTPAPTLDAPVDRDVRQDYELADRLNAKPVWDAFINKYPSGFYTEAAKAQRDKLAAEVATLEATNKAAAARQEQARLAIEGAKATEQAKAAKEAEAAEEVRVAAEKQKAIETAKVLEAERARSAALAEPLEGAKANDAKSVGPVAALSPPEQSPQTAAKPDQPALVDLPRLLQTELRRVGCLTESVGDEWNDVAQRSLRFFNKSAGMKLDVKVASLDALDAVKSKKERVCPLICDRGFKADSDRCIKISCHPGYAADEDGCEKVKKPTTKHDESSKGDGLKQTKTGASLMEQCRAAVLAQDRGPACRKDPRFFNVGDPCYSSGDIKLANGYYGRVTKCVAQGGPGR